jgi:hypothetical protein
MQARFLPVEAPKPPKDKWSKEEQAKDEGIELDEDGNPILSERLSIDYDSVDFEIEDMRKSFKVLGTGEHGTAAITERLATREDFDNALYDNSRLSVEQLEDMFHMTGYTAEMYVGSMGNGETRVQVEWYDEEMGRLVATAKNSYSEGGYAYFDLLEVESYYQGRGFASEFLGKQFRTMGEAGYYGVRLQADISIGKYAWAKAGFDYSGGWGINQAQDKLYDWLKEQQGVDAEKYRDVIYEDTWSAYDVAEFRVDERVWYGSDISNADVESDHMMHAGKAFMLDADYDGGHGSWEAEYLF